jgi:hypothetical protein
VAHTHGKPTGMGQGLPLQSSNPMAMMMLRQQQVIIHGRQCHAFQLNWLHCFSEGGTLLLSNPYDHSLPLIPTFEHIQAPFGCQSDAPDATGASCWQVDIYFPMQIRTSWLSTRCARCSRCSLLACCHLEPFTLRWLHPPPCMVCRLSSWSGSHPCPMS